MSEAIRDITAQAAQGALSGRGGHIRLKYAFRREIRALTVSSTVTFASLNAQFRQLTQQMAGECAVPDGLRLVMRYLDEENSEISIVDDRDLAECWDFYFEELRPHGKKLKIFLEYLSDGEQPSSIRETQEHLPPNWGAATLITQLGPAPYHRTISDGAGPLPLRASLSSASRAAASPRLEQTARSQQPPQQRSRAEYAATPSASLTAPLGRPASGSGPPQKAHGGGEPPQAHPDASTSEAAVSVRSPNTPSASSGDGKRPAPAPSRRGSSRAGSRSGRSRRRQEPIQSGGWKKGNIIGAGAHSKVYFAMNEQAATLFAVKQVPLDRRNPEHNSRINALQKEIDLVSQHQHENIVQYLGCERATDVFNIFLEYVPGGSIASLLTKFGCFHEKVVRSYTRQILRGLHYLHSHMVLHRDIKGGNILVSDKGQVKLADFGCSKRIQQESSGTKSSLLGTALWMAPEVIHSAQYSTASDIWGVGCTVIEMATGKPPWTQDNRFESELQAMYFIAQSNGHPRLPSHLSRNAKGFLRQCFSWDPAGRPSCEQLLQHPFITEDCVDVADIGKSPPQSVSSSLTFEHAPPTSVGTGGAVAGGTNTNSHGSGESGESGGTDDSSAARAIPHEGAPQIPPPPPVPRQQQREQRRSSDGSRARRRSSGSTKDRGQQAQAQPPQPPTPLQPPPQQAQAASPASGSSGVSLTNGGAAGKSKSWDNVTKDPPRPVDTESPRALAAPVISAAERASFRSKGNSSGRRYSDDASSPATAPDEAPARLSAPGPLRHHRRHPAESSLQPVKPQMRRLSGQSDCSGSSDPTPGGGSEEADEAKEQPTTLRSDARSPSLSPSLAPGPPTDHSPPPSSFVLPAEAQMVRDEKVLLDWLRKSVENMLAGAQKRTGRSPGPPVSLENGSSGMDGSSQRRQKTGGTPVTPSRPSSARSSATSSSARARAAGLVPLDKSLVAAQQQQRDPEAQSEQRLVTGGCSPPPTRLAPATPPGGPAEVPLSVTAPPPGPLVPARAAQSALGDTQGRRIPQQSPGSKARTGPAPQCSTPQEEEGAEQRHLGLTHPPVLAPCDLLLAGAACSTAAPGAARRSSAAQQGRPAYSPAHSSGSNGRRGERQKQKRKGSLGSKGASAESRHKGQRAKRAGVNARASVPLLPQQNADVVQMMIASGHAAGVAAALSAAGIQHSSGPYMPPAGLGVTSPPTQRRRDVQQPQQGPEEQRLGSRHERPARSPLGHQPAMQSAPRQRLQDAPQLPQQPQQHQQGQQGQQPLQPQQLQLVMVPHGAERRVRTGSAGTSHQGRRGGGAPRHAVAARGGAAPSTAGQSHAPAPAAAHAAHAGRCPPPRQAYGGGQEHIDLVMDVFALSAISPPLAAASAAAADAQCASGGGGSSAVSPMVQAQTPPHATQNQAQPKSGRHPVDA